MIDVKELRIGSHISVDGVRKRIDHIGINGELGEIYIFNPEWTKERQSKERSEHTWFCTQIEPIPLTAELLTEIGFKYSGESYEKREGDYYIAFDYGNKDMWRVHVYKRLVCLGNILCRYLHELESFVYLTIGKELIE